MTRGTTVGSRDPDQRRRHEPAAAPEGSGAAPLRVLVADDDQTVRDALAELIGGDATLRLVGCAADAQEAIELAERHEPEVAVLDVRMPAGGGRHAAREIRVRSPQTRLVALSAYGDRSAVVGMVGSGVAGYVVKGSRGEEVVRAIHEAAAGHAPLSEEVRREVVDELSDHLQRQEQDARAWQEKVTRIDAVLATRAIDQVFQPVVDLRTGTVVGAEVLSRFRDEPQRAPNLWFEEAAAVGKGEALELLAFELALERFDDLPAAAFLCVNLSPATLLSADFAALCADAPADRLVVEVTEHAPVGDYDLLEGSLRDARTRGLRVAIDDAGAGYSSLQHILRLAPDLIKLDVSLTRNLDADVRKRALAAALVPFASEIGAAVVAEGIETRAELGTLGRLGADYGQGYHLARPLPLPLPEHIEHAADAAVQEDPDVPPAKDHP